VVVRWIALGVALAAIGLGVSIEMRVRALESDLLPKLIERTGYTVQTLTSSWRSKKTTQTVTTPRNAGESDADFAKRHNDIVTLQQAAWPPDNT
jgi:hypothetical protein